jgi:hypothetical protein
VKLTKMQKTALRDVEWGVKHFGGLCAGGDATTRRLTGLEALGLVENQGQVFLCDGDGWILQPERYRTGWGLTAAGRCVTDEMEREFKARISEIQEASDG